MANVLTDVQKTDLFHALEVPYANFYAGMDPMGMAYVQTATQPILSSARDVILNFVANTMDTPGFTDLQSLLNAFNKVRLNVVEINQGGAGSLSGINLSFKNKRDQIKKLIQDLVPFYRYHEILLRQAKDAAGGGDSMQMTVHAGGMF